MALLASLSGALSASDWYVAPNGVDDPLGGSASAPWKTIGFALAQIQSEGHVIHVASGTYSPATGETYPLAMKPRVSLEGAGADTTILDGVGSGEVVRFASAFDPPISFEVDTRLAGLSIRNAHTAVVLRPAQFTPCSPMLETLRLEGIAVGVQIESSGPSMAYVRRCDIDGASQAGIAAQLEGGFGTGLIIQDSRIHGCATGVELSSATEYSAGMQLQRCSLIGCAIGVRARAVTADVYASILGSTISGCGSAVRLEPTTAKAIAELYRSTVTANDIGLTSNGLSNHRYDIVSCIVWGNSLVDLDWNGTTAFEQNYACLWSNLGGNVPPTVGGVSVDPLFISANDWHLQPGSPMIDSGTPYDDSTGEVDLDADSLELDGNADGQARSDMGADEYNLVRLSGPAVLVRGTSAGFGMMGPPGWPFLIAASTKTSTLDYGLAPFGNLLLDPDWMLVLGGGVMPTTFTTPVPSTMPSGLQIWFQSIAAHPQQLWVGSFSNRHECRVL